MALPAITAHFRLALVDVQWLVVCYVLVYGSLMLVCGKDGPVKVGYRVDPNGEKHRVCRKCGADL